MFCTNCGASIPDGSATCPSCGQAISMGAKASNAAQNVVNGAENMFNQAEKDLSSEINNIGNTFNGNNQNYNQQGGYQQGGYNQGPAGGYATPLQTDRSLVTYILLTLVTCGIYGYYFIYKMAQDVNIACEGDGENTAGLVAFILLSIVTCGIYAWIWYYKLGNRLNANAPRYGMSFQENGTTVLMWLIFGSFLCGIGAFIAMHILIKNTNSICIAYNQAHGFGPSAYV